MRVRPTAMVDAFRPGPFIETAAARAHSRWRDRTASVRTCGGRRSWDRRRDGGPREGEGGRKRRRPLLFAGRMGRAVRPRTRRRSFLLPDRAARPAARRRRMVPTGLDTASHQSSAESGAPWGRITDAIGMPGQRRTCGDRARWRCPVPEAAASVQRAVGNGVRPRIPFRVRALHCTGTGRPQ